MIKRYGLERNQGGEIFKVSTTTVKKPLNDFQGIVLESLKLSSEFQHLRDLPLRGNTNLGLHFAVSEVVFLFCLCFPQSCPLKKKYQHDLMLSAVEGHSLQGSQVLPNM